MHDHAQEGAPHDRESLARVAAKAAVRVADAWGLTDAEGAGLLGVGPDEFARIARGGHVAGWDDDRLLRASAMVGLYKGLHEFFGDALANRWPGMANAGTTFGGRSPVAFMLEGGLPALLETRAHVDALLHGDRGPAHPAPGP